MDLLMKISLHLTAEKTGLTTIIIEPWADEYRITPNAQYVVDFDTHSLGGVELNINDPYLIITSPPESVGQLKENGVVISGGRMTNRSP